MIFLPNNCHCTTLKVTPKNWKQLRTIKGSWYIHYRFYDPIRGEKLRIVKGMNKFKDIKQRKIITEELIREETANLMAGYNPFLNNKIAPEGLSEYTSLFDAFEQSLEKIKVRVQQNTYLDVKSSLKFLKKAAKKLGYQSLLISEFRRKHLREMLDVATKNKTASTFNRYKKNMGIILGELVELDLVDVNYATIIRKRKTIRGIKQILTDKERRKIDDYTKEHYPEFNRFIHIFFHSGARITELLRVKVKDVDIDNQLFLVTILKGNRPFEAVKAIKGVALPYWKDLIKGANDDDYIFSVGLEPGAEKIRGEQLTRRWKRQVKKELGINKDLYSLKHLHSDEVAKIRDINTARSLNDHTSLRTKNIYAVGERIRELERVKKS